MEDSKAEATTALRLVQKYIERDQVNFILGPLSSGELPALRDPLDQAKVIMSTYQAANRDITGSRCSRYIFRSTPTNYMQAYGLGPWIYRNVGKRGYVLTADYAAGTEIADAIVDGFTKEGGEIVAYAKAPLTTTDFAPYMAPILDSRADFVDRLRRQERHRRGEGVSPVRRQRSHEDRLQRLSDLQRHHRGAGPGGDRGHLRVPELLGGPGHARVHVLGSQAQPTVPGDHAGYRLLRARLHRDEGGVAGDRAGPLAEERGYCRRDGEGRVRRARRPFASIRATRRRSTSTSRRSRACATSSWTRCPTSAIPKRPMVGAPGERGGARDCQSIGWRYARLRAAGGRGPRRLPRRRGRAEGDHRAERRRARRRCST